MYLIIVLVTLVIGVAAQAGINAAYKKWSGVPGASGVTGEQAARAMLDRNGLTGMPIRPIEGKLTDNYDPTKRVLNLSEGVYGSTSVAAVAIACHEAGHAVQHAVGYGPIKVRTAIFPAVNVASNAWIILLIIGFAMNAMGLVWAAIILYACVVVFQLVTLPVEFDASARAIESIDAYVVMPAEQHQGTRAVLRAAAMTYVAAALASILQLLYFVGMARR